MKLFIIGLILSCSLSSIFAEETRLIELEPDEAAQIINKQDQSLRYAPKIESNVPGVRFINDHPEHVVEDIYLANQYHGQDGLGAYVYGYSIPDIAKTEKKERSGDLKGAYNYISGDGQEIKVQYWDDGTGFHQIDNVPKIQPKQVEDSPEVKAAKEEHLRIWHEQAERNSHAPADPNGAQYDEPEQQQPIQNQYQQYQEGPQPYASQNQGVTHYQPGAQPAGQPSAYQAGQYAAQTQGQQSGGSYQQPHGQAQLQGVGQPQVNPNSVEYSGQYSANQQAWAQGPGKVAGGAGSGAGVGAGASARAGAGAHVGAGAGVQHTAQGSDASASQHSANQQAWAQGSGSGKQEEEEENGPPKGFFYSFDYPTGIIVGREGKNLDLFYNQNKNLYEKQLSGEAPRPSSAASSYHASA